MTNYDMMLDNAVSRSIEKHSMPLKEVIETEHLENYRLGCVDILYADDLNVAIVPCEEYMILAREFYNEPEDDLMAEFALYSQFDDDGHNLINSLNANAEYRLKFVYKGTFKNMALAISYACGLVYEGKENGTL